MLALFSARPASLSRMVLVLAVTLTAAGCASKPDWTRKGASDAEIERDWSQCRAMADQQTGTRIDDDSASASANNNSPLANYDRRQAASRNRAIIDACMRGRGYFPTKR